MEIRIGINYARGLNKGPGSNYCKVTEEKEKTLRMPNHKNKQRNAATDLNKTFKFISEYFNKG